MTLAAWTPRRGKHPGDEVVRLAKGSVCERRTAVLLLGMLIEISDRPRQAFRIDTHYRHLNFRIAFALASGACDPLSLHLFFILLILSHLHPTHHDLGDFVSGDTHRGEAARHQKNEKRCRHPVGHASTPKIVRSH